MLCLNTVLTVRENAAFSHRNKGWEIFTDKVIELILQKDSPVVFLCWGAAAKQKVLNIKTLLHSKSLLGNHHLILTAPHPSPLSAHTGFLGCGHFIKTNEYLVKNNLKPIDWLA